MSEYNEQEKRTIETQKEVIVNLKKYFDSNAWKKDKEKYSQKGYSKKEITEHILRKVVEFI